MFGTPHQESDQQALSTRSQRLWCQRASDRQFRHRGGSSTIPPKIRSVRGSACSIAPLCHSTCGSHVGVFKAWLPGFQMVRRPRIAAALHDGRPSPTGLQSHRERVDTSGNARSVNSVDVMRPPIITIASGRSSSPPCPGSSTEWQQTQHRAARRHELRPLHGRYSLDATHRRTAAPRGPSRAFARSVQARSGRRFRTIR